ncbi:tripartite tricarboxylate transporter substrate-binding protein [Achromobacter denitrificans]|uniref:Bug family tripartite tricarboxylate transporter substrate binding protein n=1 Tax=Achromobacter denitrificans TaxID=32002 RepID=UPI0023E78FA0|nr:tripartite tricarboxylate transporter substrate-binding protein [Achromobacter denitrificans]MDF3942854.1 tripartite tricarboxylate transporter substrate-binding protein [Achromobacter denitrificans]
MPAITRRQLLIGAAASLAAHAGLVRAQSRDMSIIVAYPPGGSLDAMARMIAQHLAERRGHAVVVDNKPGFSGNIGAQYVAKAAPNGNTLLMTALTSYAINARLMGSTMGYDVLKSFEHVAIVGYLPNVLIVPASLQVNDVPSFVQAAKARPGAFSYATTGNGSLEHIAGEMFKRATGIEIEPVPYKGSTPGMADLIGDRIQAMFVNTSTAISNLQTGRIKVIGVAGPDRVAALPGVPTLGESGVNMSNNVVSIFGIAAPAGTPRAVVDQLNADLNAVLGRADVQERFGGLGIEIVTENAAYATRRIEDEVAVWDRVIQETGISLHG